jgi:uncharacterized protein (DUF2336 family)
MSAFDRDQASGPSGDADRLLTAAAQAADGARHRLATTLVDLFLPGNSRLNDQQRITMARILNALVTTVEDDFRQRLIGAMGGAATPELAAALATARVQIATPILEKARLLQDQELMAVLLRRADEHRLATGLSRATERHDNAASSLIDRLLDHVDPAVPAAAMALLIAESRRLDRFGDAILARTDLPAELQHRLVWWVAAALRDYMVERHAIDPAGADYALVTAATAMLAGYDEGDTLEARAFHLAHLLHREDALDDALLAEAVAEGRLALFAAALALRASIDGRAAWEMVVDVTGTRLAVLLRSIDCSRDIAGGIMLMLAMAEGRTEDQLADHLDAFDMLEPERAGEALRPWRLDQDYRRAIASLASQGEVAS